MPTSATTTPESTHIERPDPDIGFPTLEEIEAERTDFAIQLSWTELFALRDALEAAYRLPPTAYRL